MKVLVTGAGGQLATVLKDNCLGDVKNQFFFFTKNDLDLLDSNKLEELLILYDIDVIINCAAYTRVDQAEDESAFCYQVNELAVKQMGLIANRLGIGIIHFSTDYVFDGTSCVPYHEEDICNPATVYGDSKLKGEKELLLVCPQSVIIRTSWLYSDKGSNFVQSMLRLGKERKQLNVVFDQIGTPTSAMDLAQVVLHILRVGLKPGIYHYSNEGVCSWYDFAKAIHSLANITSCEVMPIHSSAYPTKAKRPNYSVLDKTKIKEVYQIKIPHWYDSLCEIIERSH